MGATGLLAGGAAVALTDAASKTPAAAATTATTPDWVNVTSYGADPTGATDSTTAFRTRSARSPPLAKQQRRRRRGLHPGGRLQDLRHADVHDGAGVLRRRRRVGDDGLVLRVGRLLPVYDGSIYGTRTKFGGGVVGITIDGAHATGASAGRHVGDLLQYEVDLTVQNFSKSGSIGVHFDNNYFWMEQLFGRIYAQNCASHVVFDWTSGAASTATGSFERCDLDIYIDQDGASFDGVVFQNGAFVTDGSTDNPRQLRVRQRGGDLGGAAADRQPDR